MNFCKFSGNCSERIQNFRHVSETHGKTTGGPFRNTPASAGSRSKSARRRATGPQRAKIRAQGETRLQPLAVRCGALRGRSAHFRQSPGGGRLRAGLSGKAGQRTGAASCSARWGERKPAQRAMRRAGFEYPAASGRDRNAENADYFFSLPSAGGTLCAPRV